MSGEQERHPGPGPLSITTFNVYKGNPHPAQAIEAVARDAGHPDVIVVQEAYRLSGKVDGYQTCRPGPHEFPGSDQAGDVAVLVRNGIPVVRTECRAVPGGRWRYENNFNDPRVFVRAVLEPRPGHRHDVIGVHRVPMGPVPPKEINQDAWGAEDQLLVEWGERIVGNHPERQVDLVGDWNTAVGKRPSHPLSIESLAKRLRASIHMHGIDGMLSIGGRGKYDVREHGNAHGSDHHPVSIRPRR